MFVYDVNRFFIDRRARLRAVRGTDGRTSTVPTRTTSATKTASKTAGKTDRVKKRGRRRKQTLGKTTTRRTQTTTEVGDKSHTQRHVYWCAQHVQLTDRSRVSYKHRTGAVIVLIITIPIILIGSTFAINSSNTGFPIRNVGIA